jgi:hypothetical protein
MEKKPVSGASEGNFRLDIHLQPQRRDPLECPPNIGPQICKVFLNQRRTNIKKKCFSEEQLVRISGEAERGLKLRRSSIASRNSPVKRGRPLMM